MTENMKNMMNRAKVGAVCTLPVLATGAMSITSFAEDGSATLMDSVSTSLVGACTEMAASVGGAIAQIIPIAIPLVGVGLVVKIGLRTFRNVTSA